MPAIFISRLRTLLWLLGISVLTSPTWAQGLVINEAMGSNRNTFLDDDGDSGDWLEIYNGADQVLSLEGYGLSDSEVPFKWTFPKLFIAPSERLIVFCSNKDRSNLPAHWETVIDDGETWRYLVPTSEPAGDWREPDFDDSGWGLGPSGFGLGDNDDRTVLERGTISVFVRKTFTVDDPSQVTNMLLDVDYDDGFVAYLNGVEVARANMDEAGEFPPYNQEADRYTEPRLVKGKAPIRFSDPSLLDHLVAGENVLAVQGHNSSANSSDFTLIPILTLGFDDVPAEAKGVSEVIRPYLPFPHTNFKISSSGETITLTHPDGDEVDRIETGNLPLDVSIGRYPEGTGDFSYHLEATPGTANQESEYLALGGTVEFSQPGGFYDDELSISLSTQAENGTIHYTTDGSDPDENSDTYQDPISVDETTVIRARILGEGILPTNANTHTYFIDEAFTLPVISISANPEDFFDHNTGIYVRGPNAQSDFPHFGSNFWNDWERPVHIEFFEPNGELGFSADAGTKIFGGWSRGQAQKSLSFFARKQYGVSEFNYKIFPKKDIDKFESFVLRNSGNDWQNSHFRDGMQTSLLEHLDVDRQAFRPATVFINGEYWGIQNLREKVNEHFLDANHKGVDSDEVDLLERNATVIEGDGEHYRQSLAILQQQNIRLNEVYENFKDHVNVDNFIDYQAAQIYYNNTDWPGNNIKYWRHREDGGRWRWIIYDTDFGFGIWNSGDFADNTLSFALNPNGPNWPNPPWSTFMLRTLVLNERFEQRFVNRFATHLSSVFVASRVINRISEIERTIETEMPRQRSRWGGNMGSWRSSVSNMKNFANRRVSYVLGHLRSRFGLGTQRRLIIRRDDDNGMVLVEGVELRDYPFSGTFFQGTPIEISVMPNPGYRLSSWSGVNTSSDETINLNLTSTTSSNLTVSFEIDCEASNPVVINEVNYNGLGLADPGDWVELHNQGEEDIDISGWTLRDEADDHVFTIPDDTILAADGYLVLCSDEIAFIHQHPIVTNRMGNLGFSLAGQGEELRLHDAQDQEVDFVEYNDKAPWPEEADGLGATIALKNPLYENTHAEYWAASLDGGTPGRKNTDIFEELETSCNEPPSIQFVRGDVDSNGRLDLGDPVKLLLANFRGDNLPCQAAADANANGSTDGTSDAIYLLTFMFLDGSAPASPFPACGDSILESDVSLGCEQASSLCD